MKVTLNGVGNLTDSTTAQNTINNNSSIIEDAFDNTLSLDGTQPNQMNNVLDMNSYNILNLPQPATANSPLRLQDLDDFIGGGTIHTLPVGGTTGQSLQKLSNVDYDATWGSNVTSVGLSLPADFSVTGSPVTLSGTLGATYVNTPTGTGGFVRQTSPALITPALGTPASGVATNLTGTAAGLTAGNVTTNANLTGVITSVGNATSIASQTGTGTKFVTDTSPALITPTLGVATATSINKLTLTAPASSAVLTIPDGVTLTGPAASGTAMTLGNTETVTGVKSFGSAGAVGRLRVSGNTSGVTVLDATAVASGTLTLPAATDTLVGKTTTDTLTNKTLTAPVISTISNTGTLTLPTSTDTLVGKATTDIFTNKTYDSGGTGNSLSLHGVALTTLVGVSTFRVKLSGVNLNSANTDTQINITLPTGFTRYLISGIVVGNASGSITTATGGVFSSTGGGGTAIASNQALSGVTTAAANTAGNFTFVSLTATGSGSALNFTTLQFRVGTAQGSAMTADVTFLYQPIE